jgi:hypothetical protein
MECILVLNKGNYVWLKIGCCYMTSSFVQIEYLSFIMSDCQQRAQKHLECSSPHETRWYCTRPLEWSRLWFESKLNLTRSEYTDLNKFQEMLETSWMWAINCCSLELKMFSRFGVYGFFPSATKLSPWRRPCTTAGRELKPLASCHPFFLQEESSNWFLGWRQRTWMLDLEIAGCSVCSIASDPRVACIWLVGLIWRNT